MAMINYFVEKLPETDEVFFPMTTMVDDGSIYHDLISVETISDDESNEKEIQIFTRPRHHEEETTTEQILQEISSSIDNLIQIIKAHHPDSQSDFQRQKEEESINGLMKIIIDIGGANGPLTNIWRSSCDERYFQNSYLDQRQRSASMIDTPSMNHSESQATQNTSEDFRYTTNFSMAEPTTTATEDKRLQDEIQRIYGFDDAETKSDASSRCSSVNESPSNFPPRPSMSPVILNVVSNGRHHPSITVREYYPRADRTALLVNRSVSNSTLASESTRTENNNEQVLNDYDEVLRQHPNVYQDPNPEIINEPNPHPVTYRQNIIVRYLVPPTPPAPGPLIIRETIPPPTSSPPPLIITQQNPSPTTPSPIILREAPPTPPLHQETTIINKVITSQSASAMEQEVSLPPKPQSIIIEKWLPYKPAPPREVIYERFVEEPAVSHFQPSRPISEFLPHASSSEPRDRIPISVHRENLSNEMPVQQSSLFERMAQTTQEQIEGLERRTREQIEHHQRWMENQWEQHTSLFMPMIPLMTTPTLIVNHPPIIRSTNVTFNQEAALQEHIYIEPSYLYPFYT